jgi:hypothetical protein
MIQRSYFQLTDIEKYVNKTPPHEQLSPGWPIAVALACLLIAL